MGGNHHATHLATESTSISGPVFYYYSLLAYDLQRSWRDYVQSSSCPLSMQWQHIASTPLPSTQTSQGDVKHTKESTKEKNK